MRLLNLRALLPLLGVVALMGSAGTVARAALVVADTATELALGQARQMPGGRHPNIEALPDLPDVVGDHAGLLGPQTEQALTRELSRVWINQKIEVFIRTVKREALAGYEPNALTIVRGRSGNVLVLVFTESPSTYLFALSDPLSSALGLDGVRRSVEQAFVSANKKHPADARIIATVVALLQQVVKNTTPAAAPAAASAAPAAPRAETPAALPTPTPSPPQPQPTEPTSAGAGVVTPATEAARIEPSERTESPSSSRLDARSAATPEPAPTPSGPTQPTAPPMQLLIGGGIAALVLVAFFAFRKIRSRRAAVLRGGRGLSLNAPAPRAQVRSGAPSAVGPAAASIDFRGEKREAPPQVRPAPRLPTVAPVELPAEQGSPQPVVAREKAFPAPSAGAPSAEPRFSTIRIRKDLSTAPPPSSAAWPVDSGEAATERTPAKGIGALARQPGKPTRTPLLRTMGMEPDQISVEEGSETESPEPSGPPPAPPQPADDDLLNRIETYVGSMKRSHPAQRAGMLRGLEILLLAYREKVGVPHPAAKQLEMEMPG